MKKRLFVGLLALLLLTAAAAVPVAVNFSQSPRSAFGEMMVVEPRPVAAWKFDYNINPDIVITTTANGGSVSQTNGMAKLSTSTSVSGTAKIETVKRMVYDPGQGGLLRFTAVFEDGCVEDSTQIIGGGTDDNGFFVGCNGSAFGVMRRQDGTDNWVATPGYIDPTKGNVFQIQYQWLGFGAIRWYVEDSQSGDFVLLQLEAYANKHTTPSILIPSFPLMAEITNSGNSTDLNLLTPSGMMAIEGYANEPGEPLALRRTQPATDTVSTSDNILTIRNNSTFAGQTNQILVKPKLLTVASDGTKNVQISGCKNATLGGTPSYSNINTNSSPVSFDIAGTTVSCPAGQLKFVLNLGKVDSRVLDLENFGINLNPGDALTIYGESENASAINAALTWAEKF